MRGQPPTPSRQKAKPAPQGRLADPCVNPNLLALARALARQAAREDWQAATALPTTDVVEPADISSSHGAAAPNAAS